MSLSKLSHSWRRYQGPRSEERMDFDLCCPYESLLGPTIPQSSQSFSNLLLHTPVETPMKDMNKNKCQVNYDIWFTFNVQRKCKLKQQWNIFSCFENWQLKKISTGVPVMAQRKWIWLVSLMTQARSLALLSGLRIQCCHSCGVGRRHISDLALLWLWCRPVAVAPIRHLAWEPPYAADAALKRQNQKQK